MDRRPTTLLFIAAAFLVGLGLFVGVRWSAVAANSSVAWPEIMWFAVPLAATYAGAAAIGVLLVRDGVTRWWWLPATLFVAIGLPVEGWVTGSNVIGARSLPIAGSAVDLLAILAPAFVLLRRAPGSRPEIPGRVVPIVVVTAISIVLAMLVGQNGPDVSLSVGVAVLAFGACSRAASWHRALAFVAIALALGAHVPGSFALAIAQGNIAPVAIRDASAEVVVACLCFAIAPAGRAWARLLARRTGNAALAEA